jgi:hypothetical protein
MRDEASLARLEEMGFAVYMRRGMRSAPAPASTAAAGSPHAVGAPRSGTRTGSRARVVLLAREDSKPARALIAGVRRALAFARIDSEVATAIDEPGLGDAKGLVAFGDAFAREVGVRVSATRQAALAWVATGEAAAVAVEAPAKRALWSELRRLARALDAGTS